MSKSSAIKNSEIYTLELHRRIDEIYAIIGYAVTLFSIESSFIEELNELKRLYKNKWLWISLVIIIILNSALRQSGFLEFKFEWNFGTYLLTLWLLIVAGNHINQHLIIQKIERNKEKIRDLVFRFDAITSEGYKLWELPKFLDESGQINTDDSDDVNKNYTIWLGRIRENVEYKLKNYFES